MGFQHSDTVLKLRSWLSHSNGASAVLNGCDVISLYPLKLFGMPAMAPETSRRVIASAGKGAILALYYLLYPFGTISFIVCDIERRGDGQCPTEWPKLTAYFSVSLNSQKVSRMYILCQPTDLYTSTFNMK